ncbi:GNAT family N-acetyltransferase [Hespellia stercorisuis]|uniref:Predicted acetyltransferase n=1 Tax=Hespellia stercorisuis DSM 15480 TaxID=1121950 RepID=A0A1M6K5A5_9FIRM|nr:GNAT family N-acetyltransferase [Hespellia stercorisuis]SHJ54020.1 Predicted acetyltransferase [Hespellia stercorisuis DSM 15480]
MNSINEIILVKPTKDMEIAALEYRKEHFDYGERIINGSELFDQIEDYDEWLEKVTANSKEETVSNDWVLTDTFFALRQFDNRIVGIVDLRYELNDFLKDFGHCGYSVRPSERQKGYATRMLSKICQIASQHGLKELQLSVEKNNLPSVKTILKNGGVYQRSFVVDSEIADVYHINL